MINKLFYILLFLGSTFVYSQENINISGQLFDSETKESIPFVNVSVHNFDNNKLITGTITDMDGRFVIQGLMVGKYELYFSYIGYKGAQQTLVAGGLNNVFNSPSDLPYSTDRTYTFLPLGTCSKHFSRKLRSSFVQGCIRLKWP